MAALAKSWRRGKACATRRLAARFRVSPKDLPWGWWQAEEGGPTASSSRTVRLAFFEERLPFLDRMSLGQSWVLRCALNEYTTLLSASIERVADWEDRLPPPSPGDENRLQCGRDQAGIQLELRSDVRSIFAHKQREAVKGSQENAYETLVNSDSWVAR